MASLTSSHSTCCTPLNCTVCVLLSAPGSFSFQDLRLTVFSLLLEGRGRGGRGRRPREARGKSRTEWPWSAPSLDGFRCTAEYIRRQTKSRGFCETGGRPTYGGVLWLSPRTLSHICM